MFAYGTVCSDRTSIPPPLPTLKCNWFFDNQILVFAPASLREAATTFCLEQSYILSWKQDSCLISCSQQKKPFGNKKRNISKTVSDLMENLFAYSSTDYTANPLSWEAVHNKDQLSKVSMRMSSPILRTITQMNSHFKNKFMRSS